MPIRDEVGSREKEELEVEGLCEQKNKNPG